MTKLAPPSIGLRRAVDQQGLDRDVYTLLATNPVWVGLDLLRPGSTFDTSRVWTLFARIADETTWAIVFLLLGAVGWAGMLTTRPALRLTSLCVLAVTAFATALLFALGSPLSTGTGTYVLIAMLAFRLVGRLRHV